MGLFPVVAACSDDGGAAPPDATAVADAATPTVFDARIFPDALPLDDAGPQPPPPELVITGARLIKLEPDWIYVHSAAGIQRRPRNPLGPAETLESESELIGLGGLAIDDTYLYMVKAESGWKLKRQQLVGGSEILLRSGIVDDESGTPLRALGDYVYSCESDGVKRTHRDSGAASILGGGGCAGFTITDGGMVYYDDDAFRTMSVPIDGSAAPTQVSTGTPCIRYAANADYIVCQNFQPAPFYQELVRSSLSGGPRVTIATLPGADIYSIHIVDSTVYFIEQNVYDNVRRLKKVSIDGGPFSDLAVDVGYTVVAFDAGYVYFNDLDGNIVRTPM